jgi:hypothetical protein
VGATGLSIVTHCVYDKVNYDIVARCQQGIQGNGGFCKQGPASTHVTGSAPASFRGGLTSNRSRLMKRLESRPPV